MEEGGEAEGESSLTSRQSSVNRPEKSWMARQWAGLDTKIFKPLLTHSNPTLMDTLPNRCLPIGRLFTSREQLMRHPMMQPGKEGGGDRDESPDLCQTSVTQPPLEGEGLKAAMEAGHM